MNRLRRAGTASSLKLETPILVGQLLNMQSKNISATCEGSDQVVRMLMRRLI